MPWDNIFPDRASFSMPPYKPLVKWPEGQNNASRLQASYQERTFLASLCLCERFT
jgi:hypothetical protein